LLYPVNSERQPPKILICLPFFTLGGAETQAYLLADYLHNTLKIDVEVCAFYNKTGQLCQILKRKNIPYFLYEAELSILHKKGIKKIFFLLKFGLFLRKRKYDNIIPFTYYPNLICNLIKIISGAKNCFWNQRGMELLPISKLEDIAKFFKPKYIGNSQACIDYIYKRHHVKNQNGIVIRNAVNIEPPKLSKEEWQKRINKELDTVIITCVANFYPEKDHPVIIRALSYLINELKITQSIKLVLAGNAPNEFFLFRVKAMVMDLKLQNEVVFIDASDDIAGLLESTDIGLLASISEGCPNAILEYMACKLPVVATKIPAIIEIFGENYDFYFEAGEEKILAEKLKVLIENNSLRQDIGENNCDIVFKKFSPQKMFDGYKKLLKLSHE